MEIKKDKFSWGWSNKLAPFEIEYSCFQDCEQPGCPGHKMEFILNSTSDIIEIKIDGEHFIYLNPKIVEVLLQGLYKLQ